MSIPNLLSIFGNSGGGLKYEGTYLFKSVRNYNTSASSWTVPSGIKYIMIRAMGSGAEASNYNNTYPDGNGGSGGYSTGIMEVTPGQVLKVAVGSNSNNGRGYGPYASGGGFSGVLTGPNTPSDPEPSWTSHLIAGGGGGAVINSSTAGGAGGGSSGQPGFGPAPNGKGCGGTQSAGGTSQEGSQYYGSYLKGGPGGNGGGGGGGYYGGAAGGGQGGGGGGSGRIDGPLMIPQSEGGPFINYYTGNGRIIHSSGYNFTEYPLLGSSPTSPTQSWGAGGQGQNSPNRNYQRNNGYVIIHAFSGGIVPSADDLPQNVNDFVISATY